MRVPLSQWLFQPDGVCERVLSVPCGVLTRIIAWVRCSLLVFFVKVEVFFATSSLSLAVQETSSSGALLGGLHPP